MDIHRVTCRVIHWIIWIKRQQPRPPIALRPAGLSLGWRQVADGLPTFAQAQSVGVLGRDAVVQNDDAGDFACQLHHLVACRANHDRHVARYTATIHHVQPEAVDLNKFFLYPPEGSEPAGGNGLTRAPAAASTSSGQIRVSGRRCPLRPCSGSACPSSEFYLCRLLYQLSRPPGQR